MDDQLQGRRGQTASQNIETSAEIWITLANQYLQKLYGVTIEDVGYMEAEFFERWHDQGRTPEEAIHAFAEKYDLQAVEPW